MAFRFLNYSFDKDTGLASFKYENDKIIFDEQIRFVVPDNASFDEEILDRALFLTFVVIGTSYYKAHPTREVILDASIDAFQAEVFNKIYQEGLSQFAYENHLKRDDLAYFEGVGDNAVVRNSKMKHAILAFVSGGKDSLLAAEKIRESGTEYKVAYISSYDGYPNIIEEFKKPVVIRRFIDKENLKRAGGMNGHVPVTIINQALAAVQAILFGFSIVDFGIGKEGLEPHAMIGDLPVNHQWSKTKEAQDLLKEYIRRYIATDLVLDSVLKEYNELEIAEQFAKLCWDKFGDKFSSCNVANYRQDADNRVLKWCGKCAKCANSYLLFAPFVEFEKQKQIFGRDLFTDPEMTEIFKGLLGVDGVMKPFECVASIEELKWAYEHRLPGYGRLPFRV